MQQYGDKKMFSNSTSQEYEEQRQPQPIKIIRAPSSIPKPPNPLPTPEERKTPVAYPLDVKPLSTAERYFTVMQQAESLLYYNDQLYKGYPNATALELGRQQPLVSQNRIIRACNCVLYALNDNHAQMFAVVLNLYEQNAVDFALYQTYLKCKTNDGFLVKNLRDLVQVVLLYKASASLQHYFAATLFQTIVLSKELSVAHAKALKQLVLCIDPSQREYYSNLYDIQTNLATVSQSADQASFKVALTHENLGVLYQIIKARRLSQREKALLAASKLRQDQRIQLLLSRDYGFCYMLNAELPLCHFEQKIEVLANIERFYRAFVEYFIVGIRRKHIAYFLMEELEWTSDVDDVQKCLVVAALVYVGMFEQVVRFEQLWGRDRKSDE